MDKIIYRALRVVFNDHAASYDDLLQRCDMDDLELSRQKTLLCEIYKSINDIGPKYMQDIFCVKRRESRRGLLLLEHRPRTSLYGTHSARVLGPKLWNSLSTEIKTCKSINELKTKLKNFKGQTCKCALCKNVQFYILVFLILLLIFTVLIIFQLCYFISSNTFC